MANYYIILESWRLSQPGEMYCQERCALPVDTGPEQSPRVSSCIGVDPKSKSSEHPSSFSPILTFLVYLLLLIGRGMHIIRCTAVTISASERDSDLLD